MARLIEGRAEETRNNKAKKEDFRENVIIALRHIKGSKSKG